MTDLNNGSTGAGSSGGSQGETPSPKQMLSEAKQATQDQVQGLTAKAADTAKEQVNKGKDTATRTLGDFADAIRKAGDELASRDQSTVGRVVKQAADSLEGLSRSVADKRPEELLDALRDFGRKNPAAFVAGSVLVGLAIARFAKSSANRPQTSESASVPTYATGGPRPNIGEPRSFVTDVDDTARTSTTTGSAPYESAGPAVTAPLGSGTGGDPTADPFADAIHENRDRAGRGGSDTAIAGGTQGTPQ